MSLTVLLYDVQMFLYGGSSLLLAGSLAGLYMQNRLASEKATLFISGIDKKSSAGEEPYREKRRARRLPSQVPLEIMDPSGEFVADSARMRDLSISGACFDSPLIMNQGNRIVARIHSSKEGLLRISARIVWLRPKNDRIAYGVEFDTIRPAHS